MLKFRRKPQEEYTSPRVYKQMAVTPEAHERIVKLADKKGESIIDTVDKIMGVR